MKKDPYGHEERFKRWKEQVKKTGIPEVSKYNSDLIIEYLDDMEHGINKGYDLIKMSKKNN